MIDVRKLRLIILGKSLKAYSFGEEFISHDERSMRRSPGVFTQQLSAASAPPQLCRAAGGGSGRRGPPSGWLGSGGRNLFPGDFSPLLPGRSCTARPPPATAAADAGLRPCGPAAPTAARGFQRSSSRKLFWERIIIKSSYKT
jgi:hypothetical protein